jgi:hypothetical protein
VTGVYHLRSRDLGVVTNAVSSAETVTQVVGPGVWGKYLGGLAAGVIDTFVMAPIECTKTRTQALVPTRIPPSDSLAHFSAFLWLNFRERPGRKRSPTRGRMKAFLDTTGEPVRVWRLLRVRR